MMRRRVGLAAMALWATLGFPATGEAQPAGGKWAPGDVFKDCAECPEMVVLPSGTFRMGSEDEVNTDGSVTPVRDVDMAAFALGRFEVTQGQYAAFVGATGRPTDDGCQVRTPDENGVSRGPTWIPGLSWRAPGFDHDENHPVVCTDWADATAYVAWLSGLTGHKYRLPSEAEWEFAARAGTETRYHWGDDWNCDYGNVLELSWQDTVVPIELLGVCHDRARHTAPVGSFSPNDFGLHDMMGNVWEWTADCWHDDYGNAPEDGTPWMDDGDCSYRSMRGLGWDLLIRGYLMDESRGRSTVAVRLQRDIGYARESVGFRVARMLEY